MAAEASLSPSAFHRQFKAVTSMTPIQYQKQLMKWKKGGIYEVPGQMKQEQSRFSVALGIRVTGRQYALGDVGHDAARGKPCRQRAQEILPAYDPG